MQPEPLETPDLAHHTPGHVEVVGQGLAPGASIRRKDRHLHVHFDRPAHGIVPPDNAGDREALLVRVGSLQATRTFPAVRGSSLTVPFRARLTRPFSQPGTRVINAGRHTPHNNIGTFLLIHEPPQRNDFAPPLVNLLPSAFR
jgi:hypothetical protein